MMKIIKLDYQQQMAEYTAPSLKTVELKPRQIIAVSNPYMTEEGGETGESWEF